MKNAGVSSSSAHARRASIDSMSRKAPISWKVVTQSSGMMFDVALLTVLMSFSSLDVTSPECNSFWSNICRRSRWLKMRRRILVVCTASALTVR